MALTAGTRIGPYEVIDRLGSGGMGEIYRARDTRLGRNVALKLVRPDAGLDQRQLLHEARLASSLNDPHIVSVFDVGEQDGAVFLAMELVEGTPLGERVRRGSLRIEEALRLGVQIASALARAHAAGLVHRDLKPANMMVTADGKVKVLDFGLAKRVESLSGDTSTVAGISEPGLVVGTAAYMSPEQAEGRPVDARSDIFAFGVTLYEMLTGRRPFERESAIATLAAILRDPVEPLDHVRPDTPPELVRIVDRCLRRDPARRFQSAADLKVALEDVLEDLARQPPHPAPGRAAAAPVAPRSPWRWVAAGTAMLAGGVAIGALMPRGTRIPPAPVVGDLTQVTFDAGYSGAPALSPDGTLVAFASDRSGEGNLDIWVQPVAGGNPVRVTADPVDERAPSFSPDGSRIVFRSEREGGGLYTVPALGGDARLLVNEGQTPRFSPDGTRVAYWTGSPIGASTVPGSYRTFVVDATGGSPRELTGFTGARFPLWSPDGRAVILTATQAGKPTLDTYDWWIVPLEGGAPAVTGARAFLPRSNAPLDLVLPPLAWVGSRVLTSALGDVWAVDLDDSSAPRATAGHRVTFGPASEQEPTSTSGGLVAFSHVSLENAIWALPIDSETGALAGELRRVTEGVGPYTRATVSADDRLIAYQFRLSRPTILLMDLASGRTRDLEAPVGGTFGPGLSPDGTRVVFQDEAGGLSVVSVDGGAPRQICGADCDSSGDWTRDGRYVTAVVGAGSLTSIALIDTATGERRMLAEHGADDRLNRPHLTHDNRWLAFRVMGQENQIYVAPFGRDLPIPRASWIPVGAPENDVRPVGWASSGRMLYFVSARDGFRCLYVQPMADGRPQGDARLVRHMHNLRGMGGGGGSVISTGAGNAVMRDRILLDFPTQVVNVWTMRMESEPSSR